VATAVGDIASTIVSLAAGTYMTIRPTGTEQWVIHNLGWYGTITTAPHVEWYEPTSSLVCIITTDSASGGLLGCNFHVNNAQYIRVKNNNVSNALVTEYDGVVTRL
jgi:hypothetical protein